MRNLKAIAVIVLALTLGRLAYSGSVTYLNGQFIRNGSGLWTIPVATDQLVGLNTSDVLTNKSMSGSSNTFTNIPASALLGSAACTVSTVATGTTLPSTITNCYIQNVDTSGGALSNILPSAATSGGFCVDMKNLSTNAITVTAPSAQTIDGSSSDTISGQYSSRHYCAVGGNWFIY